jgi:lipid II:glycine glycyltransferase (peptidoglycan interpeptide bridge formation enzyme)
MYAGTASRDGFIIRPEDYYLDVWSRFMKAGMAEGLIAEFEGQPLAGLVYFFLGPRAWYVYGMSRNLYREKMPNYLLQWEAMKAAKEKGCQVYDLWGAPDTITDTDPMFGVYRFKEGLGAHLFRTIGAWDYPVNSMLYFTYHQVIPRILNITRFIRRRQIRQETL